MVDRFIHYNTLWVICTDTSKGQWQYSCHLKLITDFPLHHTLQNNKFDQLQYTDAIFVQKAIMRFTLNIDYSDLLQLSARLRSETWPTFGSFVVNSKINRIRMRKTTCVKYLRLSTDACCIPADEYLAEKAISKTSEIAAVGTTMIRRIVATWLW